MAFQAIALAGEAGALMVLPKRQLDDGSPPPLSPGAGALAVAIEAALQPEGKDLDWPPAAGSVCVWYWSEAVALEPQLLNCDELVRSADRVLVIRGQFADVDRRMADLNQGIARLDESLLSVRSTAREALEQSEHNLEALRHQLSTLSGVEASLGILRGTSGLTATQLEANLALLSEIVADLETQGEVINTKIDAISRQIATP